MTTITLPSSTEPCTSLSATTKEAANGPSAPASTWVRVQQPLAGDGTGMSFIPRIGHEVLVGFFDDDIERPYVMCSLYNGRGEGGEAVTPGGGDAQDID